MPSRLGRYVVRRRIGAGAFATVWLAYDEQLDSPVAVKVLADNWTSDQHVRQRFLEEGRYLRRVESPHVVSVYDAGELDDGRPYLVMTYADHGTLADRLEVEGLGTGQALEVVRQVGAGLTALHERGIAHRDLKPANVLFRADGDGVRAMVADLGLGKALEASSRLTLIAGTPSFVAPEQARGEGLDARADQFSLGALTYLLLAGRPPHAHTSLQAAADPRPPEPLSTPDRPFPPAVDAAVRRALAPDREDRWPSVAAFVEALASALDGTTAAVDPSAQTHTLDRGPTLEEPGPAHRPRRTGARAAARVAAAGVVALVAGAAGGWAWESGRADEVTVTAEGGALAVTVPERWHGAVARSPWTPPEADQTFPALAVGSTVDWQGASDGEGVFVGVMPSSELPDQLPQHPECSRSEPPASEGGAEPATTVVHTGCPGGVLVERAVRIGADRLLWVQVRSATRATAERVLATVETDDP